MGDRVLRCPAKKRDFHATYLGLFLSEERHEMNMRGEEEEEEEQNELSLSTQEESAQKNFAAG